MNDETNMECVCKEGYHMDATTGMCFSCEDKIEGCDTCTITAGGIATCSSCKYSFLMLNSLAASNKCVHKLNNCQIPLHEQVYNTFDTDSNGMPVCEVCNDGYFWNITWTDSKNKVHPGFCERCGLAVKDCLACSTGSHCLECQHDLLVSPSGSKCLSHLPNCALLSSSYTVNEALD